MNRLALMTGLALMEVCWLYVASVLLGLWSDVERPRPLLSAASVLGVVLLGALSTHALGRRTAASRASHLALGRRTATSRASRLALAGLGLVTVLVVVRLDQYPDTAGLEWLGSLVATLALVLGQLSRPALAFALGLCLWWRGVRLGSQTSSFSDVEHAFRWGTGLLVGSALVMVISTRPSLLPTIEAQTTPFVVAFFFVSLVTLALGRLESLRTRTRALAINTQWLGVLVTVAGLVVLSALLLGQLVSFDVLIVATRPIFDLLGQVILLALYIVIIPLAFVVEWLIYLVLSLMRGNLNQPPPQPLQPGDVDNVLQRLLSQAVPPELLLALKAVGAMLLLIAALLIVARAASHWRPSADESDATAEERDSLWRSGRLRALVLAWLKRLLRRDAQHGPHAADASPMSGRIVPSGQVSTVRELYRQLLALGEAVGAPRHPATTPLEHLPSLQRALEPATDVASVTSAYLSARYAETLASAAELAAVQDGLEHVHRRTDPETLVQG